MPKDISLSRRAAIAMALTIGFYMLALIVGLGTIAFPFILAYFTGQIFIKLVVVCLVTGVTILAAMAPRMDKFEPPGPLLTPTANPKLFEVITEIALKTGQQVPDHVYLIYDFNAWVAQRGGANGFGGNRIMGLGLPLLKELNVSQFKAIMAHEFGHYHHGDTSLGPRIYQIRAAIGRTIEELQKKGSFMQLPFLWYGHKFLKITGGISRSQEFGADRLAANLIGKNAMINALEVTTMKGSAFEEYWYHEFSPMIEAGFLPPLLEGYDLYLKSKVVQARMSEDMQEELKGGKTDEYDSHPSLKERLNAIVALNCDGGEIDPTPAFYLIEDPARLERALLKSMIKYDYFKTLKLLSWDDDRAPIYISKWKEDSRKFAALLKDVTPGKLPDIVKDPTNCIKLIESKESFSNEEPAFVIHQLQYTLTIGLALMLLNDGWNLHIKLGDDIRLSKGDVTFEPFSVIADLAFGKMTLEQWLAFCNSHGITDRSLFLEPVEKSWHPTG